MKAISSLNYKKNISLAKVLAILLVGMYGLTPLIVDVLGLYTVPWSTQNLLLSLSLIIYLYFMPSKLQKWQLINTISENLNIKNYLIYFLFVVSLIIFYIYPWHDDRESLGASVAAFFRAAWLLVMFSCVAQNEKRKLLIFILSIILMYIDESRTYFMIGILAIAASSIYRKKLIFLALFSVVLLASVRMDVSGSALQLILYGIIGEGYNATKPVGQILSISDENINYVGHLFQTFLQPIIFPVEFIGNRVFNLSLPQQFDYFSSPVERYLGEKLSPMGGWYIVADFVYYGAIGIPLLIMYMHMVWVVTCKIFNTSVFPFGSFIFLISIKATPYVYWKFIFYLVVVFFVIQLLNKFSINGRQRSRLNNIRTKDVLLKNAD